MIAATATNRKDSSSTLDNYLTSTIEFVPDLVCIFLEAYIPKSVGVACGPYLARIVSDGSLSRGLMIVESLRHHLGNLIQVAKLRDNVEARFLEITTVKSILGDSIGQPSNHTIDITVEVIIKSKSFEEAINLFIKRVAEEAYNAGQSSMIITTHLKATPGNRDEELVTITIEMMRKKRQQVLSLLKTAVVNDGLIFIELYMKVQRQLPNYVGNSVSYFEPTAGFVRVKRKYNFSFTDASTGKSRCFAEHPIESLLTGVFMGGIEDYNLYKSVFLGHKQQMEASKKVKGKKKSASSFSWFESRAESRSVSIADGVIDSLSATAMSHLQAGEVTQGVSVLIVLQAVLTLSSTQKNNPEPRPPLSYVLKQLSAVSLSLAGQLESVRQAVQVLQQVCDVIVSAIEHSTALFNHAEDDPVTEEETREIALLLSHYAAIPAAIQELRMLLLGLVRDNVAQSSELTIVAAGLQHELWQLFSGTDKAEPILDPDPERVSKKGLSGVAPNLKFIASALARMSTYLEMGASSVGMSILRGLLASDTVGAIPGAIGTSGAGPGPGAGAKTAPSAHTGSGAATATGSGTRVEVEGGGGGVAGSRGSGGGEMGSRAADQDGGRPLHSVPRTLSELLGYASARSLGAATWTPFKYADHVLPAILMGSGVTMDPLALMSRLQAANPQSTVSKIMNYFSSQSTEEEVEDGLIHMLRAANEDEENTWQGHFADVFESLGSNSLARFGAVDMRTAIEEEFLRYDLPRVVCAEGLKLRYLQDTLLARALREGIFAVSTRRSVEQPYPILLKHLHKFSAYFELSEGISDSALVTHSFHSVLNCLLEPLPAVDGAYKCSVACSGLSAKSTAGLYGSERLLSVLGNVNNIYRLAWLIPPICATPVRLPPGMRGRLHCGISAETAVHWGKADMHSLKQQQQAANYDVGAVDPDNGHLDQFDAIELEVVVKISYDHTGLRDRLHAEFAASVLQCCQHLASSSAWYFDKLVAGEGIATTVPVVAGVGTGAKAAAHAGSAVSGYGSNMGLLGAAAIRRQWGKEEVLDAEAGHQAAILAALARRGSAVVDASFYMVEGSAQPTVEQILTLLENGRAGNGTKQQQAKARKDTFDIDGDASSESEREPTTDDFDRVYASGLTAGRVRRFMGAVHAVRYLVPCRLRFSFLADLPAHIAASKFRGGGSGASGSSGGIGSRVAQFRTRRQVQQAAPAASTVVGAVGAMARLMAGTVWLSPLSLQEVWACSSKPIAAAVAEEGRRRFQLYKSLAARGAWADAFVECYIASALIEAYDLLPSCSRAISHKSLCTRLGNAARFTAMARSILGREHGLAVDVTALAHTIARQISLAVRLAVASPQSVHLRGGCYWMLKKVEELKSQLALSSIPITAAIDGLSSSLIPAAPREGIEASASTSAADAEAKFRSALGNANRLIAAVKILGELEAACALLAWAMGQDVLEAFSPPLNRFHNATAVDTLGLGVREAMEFALGSKEAAVAQGGHPAKQRWQSLCRDWAGRRNMSIDQLLNNGEKNTADKSEVGAALPHWSKLRSATQLTKFPAAPNEGKSNVPSDGDLLSAANIDGALTPVNISVPSSAGSQPRHSKSQEQQQQHQQLQLLGDTDPPPSRGGFHYEEGKVASSTGLSVRPMKGGIAETGPETKKPGPETGPGSGGVAANAVGLDSTSSLDAFTAPSAGRLWNQPQRASSGPVAQRSTVENSENSLLGGDTKFDEQYEEEEEEEDDEEFKPLSFSASGFKMPVAAQPLTRSGSSMLTMLRAFRDPVTAASTPTAPYPHSYSPLHGHSSSTAHRLTSAGGGAGDDVSAAGFSPQARTRLVEAGGMLDSLRSSLHLAQQLQQRQASADSDEEHLDGGGSDISDFGRGLGRRVLGAIGRHSGQIDSDNNDDDSDDGHGRGDDSLDENEQRRLIQEFGIEVKAALSTPGKS